MRRAQVASAVRIDVRVGGDVDRLDSPDARRISNCNAGVFRPRLEVQVHDLMDRLAVSQGYVRRRRNRGHINVDRIHRSSIGIPNNLARSSGCSATMDLRVASKRCGISRWLRTQGRSHCQLRHEPSGQVPRMCWFSDRLRLALDGHADSTVPHASMKMVRLRTTAEFCIARRKGILHAEDLAICLGDVWLGILGNQFHLGPRPTAPRRCGVRCRESGPGSYQGRTCWRWGVWRAWYGWWNGRTWNGCAGI